MSVIYGLGGLPLRGADLIQLCRQAPNRHGSRLYLGMEFTPRTSDYPKRQVLLDRLRRDYPDIEGLGLRSRDTTPDLRPAGALTLSVHRRTGQWGEGLATEAAAFLRRLAGKHLRSHPALFAQPLGSYCVERFTCSEQELRDPGASMPVDLAVLALDPGAVQTNPLIGLQPDGALLVQGPEQDVALWQSLSAGLQRALHGSFIALYAAPPTALACDDELLGAICGVLVDREWLDLGLRRLISSREEQLRSAGDPKPTGRLERFQAGLDGLRRVEYRNLPATEVIAKPEQEAPASVRRLGNIDDAYDSLPRFWDQVGVLYQDGATSQLAPTPYMAAAAVPPLLSAFRDLSPLRATLPRLDPQLCTGCGDCWSQCPEGAWEATAATSREALGATIPAAEAGALRPLAGKLAERIEHLCRGASAPATLGGLIREAYAWLGEKMSMPEERRQTLDSAARRLAAYTDHLPVTLSPPFFGAPDSQSPGTGALLFLALDPNDCKGCGICVRACSAGALSTVAQSEEALEQASRGFKTWEQLPETSPEIIARSAADPQVGPLAATLLARGPARALAGGDGAEAGSGERLALRLALAVAESRQDSRRAEFAQEVRETHQAIAALIRSILADALPADDLDALARTLEAVDTRQADLGSFLGQAEGAIESAVDAARLRRLVELARGLGELAWRLQEGRQGLGRALLGLVLSPGETVSWAGAFPHNAFQVPVTLDASGDGARLAAGLLEGQLRQAVEGCVLLRRARLELDKPAEAVRLWSDLSALGWRDLTPKERASCRFMLRVGSSRVLAGSGLSQVAALLNDDLPLKILVLADLDLGLSTHAVLESAPAPAPDATTDLALLALARRHAYVAQTSLAAPNHLLEGLTGGLDFPGPALLHIHTPSPGRHGFATDRTLVQAHLAVATRTFPLLRYNPRADGVFGSRIDLAANPEPLATWGLHQPAGSAVAATSQPQPQALTPAHWALGEARFRDWLAPLSQDAPEPLPLDAFLELPERDRHARTPFVSRERETQEPARFAVAPELLEACAKRLDAWRLLQELAGLVTPFTERVRREAEEQVADAHRAELQAQAADYEHRLANLREQLHQELRGDIRGRLMSLAGYHQVGGQDDSRRSTQ